MSIINTLLLSDRALAYASTPCFRIDIMGSSAALVRWPGDVVTGSVRISSKFLSVYHSMELRLISEARIRASVQMPQGNVVPNFERVTLWKTPSHQVWPASGPASTDAPKPDELGLVSVPFALQLPKTFAALPASPFQSKKAPIAQQIPLLPSCTLPPGLQIHVYVVAEARRTSTFIKKPRKDVLRLPILLHREPKNTLLRWLPPIEDPHSHKLRFDPRYWTSSTTVITLKQSALDRRRLWVTLSIPNVARVHGAAESERLPFLLEITYQSKRQNARKPGGGSSTSKAPPGNMVDQTALPTLPLTSAKSELEPHLFVGQRVACQFEDGTTSDFRHDRLEVEWDAFHLEHSSAHLPASASSAPGSAFASRNRVEVRPNATASGLEIFHGHGWTLPEWKSITEIKALRRELERGSYPSPTASAADDVLAVEEGDDEEVEAEAEAEAQPSAASKPVAEADKHLAHHTSSALSHLRKALFGPVDPDTVGYWLSRAAVSGTFRAPVALPSFDYHFGPELKQLEKDGPKTVGAGGGRGGGSSSSGFESGRAHERGRLALSYELGVGWTVPESAVPAPEKPRSSGPGRKRTVVSYKTVERGLMPWVSAATGAVLSGDGDDDDDDDDGDAREGPGGRPPSRGSAAAAHRLLHSASTTTRAARPLAPPTRADVLRTARAKCKAAKLGRTEPDLSAAEAEALEEAAQVERVASGRWSGRRCARPRAGDGAEETHDDDNGADAQRSRLDALNRDGSAGIFFRLEDYDEAQAEREREREAAERKRLREASALLNALPPEYFSSTADFEAAGAGGEEAAQGALGGGQLRHNHPVKS